jgi:hypothetical protein
MRTKAVNSGSYNESVTEHEIEVAKIIDKDKVTFDGIFGKLIQDTDGKLWYLRDKRNDEIVPGTKLKLRLIAMTSVQVRTQITQLS